LIIDDVHEGLDCGIGIVGKCPGGWIVA